MKPAQRHPRHAFIARDLAPRGHDAAILTARRAPSAIAALWLIDMDASAAALARNRLVAQRWLTPSDYHRLKRIRDRNERARRAATYVALRMLVADLLGRRHAMARMVRPLGGKPRLAGVPISFNLSHSGPFGLIGIARRGRVGVDIEEARDLPMATRHRTRIVEAASVIGSDRALLPEQDADVIQGWTRLEAFSKATGRGINRTLADFGIRKQGNARLHTPGASVEERARRQIPRHVVRDLAFPLGIKASLVRGF